jgi:hypothetical protein
MTDHYATISTGKHCSEKVCATALINELAQVFASSNPIGTALDIVLAVRHCTLGRHQCAGQRESPIRLNNDSQVSWVHVDL